MKICWSGYQCVPPLSPSLHSIYLNSADIDAVLIIAVNHPQRRMSCLASHCSSGNIIAWGHSLAIRPHESTSPCRTGSLRPTSLTQATNLPCQTNGNTTPDSTSSIDDWHVAIAWGRMLISPAYEVNNSPPYHHPQLHAPSPSTLAARPSPLPPSSIPTPQLCLSHSRNHPCLPLAATVAEYTEHGKLHHHLGLLIRGAECEVLCAVCHFVQRWARFVWFNT